MAVKKTHDEYVKQLFNINPNIEVIDEYRGGHTKILHRCLIDGNEWFTCPSRTLQGHGCKICSNKKNHDLKQKSHEQYVEELSCVNKNIDVLEYYINTSTPILHKCKIDGHEWKARPANILNGKGCPACSKCKKRTHEEYVAEVKNINQNIEVIGIYSGVHTPILHKCIIDGNEWMASPSNILHGKGCPLCNDSKGEKEIQKYLTNKNISFIPQYRFKDCRNKNPLPFDFYLDDYNVCIEYDGIQHFEPRNLFGGIVAFEDIKKHDTIKTNYCLANNIKLLRIRYDEDVIIVLDNFFNHLITQNYYERTN